LEQARQHNKNSSEKVARVLIRDNIRQTNWGLRKIASDFSRFQLPDNDNITRIDEFSSNTVPLLYQKNPSDGSGSPSGLYGYPISCAKRLHIQIGMVGSGETHPLPSSMASPIALFQSRYPQESGKPVMAKVNTGDQKLHLQVFMDRNLQVSQGRIVGNQVFIPVTVLLTFVIIN